MASCTEGSQVDTKRIFWRSFVLIFLVRELIVWNLIQRIPVREPSERVILFLLAPRATPTSLAWALIGGGALSLLAVLIDYLIVRPILNWWLSPLVDSSSGLFHLASGESIVTSVPARRNMGWAWQAGTLVLTDRRLWFFPAAWDESPWSLDSRDFDRIEPRSTILATLAPIRCWPEILCFWARSGEKSLFAMANPDAMLGWFRPSDTPNSAEASPFSEPSQGAFDV
jgi:hypothetical protein